MAEVTDPSSVREPPRVREPTSMPEPAPIHVVTGVDSLARDDEHLFFAVGVFDGLHRGHAYLLRHLRSAARAHGARAAVVTFDAHPDAVILGHAPALLLDPVERLGRLACAGVAVTVVQHFDETLRRTPYDVFVHAIASRTHLAGFLMTPEAAFGHERRGTPQALATLGAELGYEVVVVAPFELDGGPVRSERIRRCIEDGDLGEARRLLGRSLAVVGTPAPVTAGLAEVTFDLPVALPPPGRYRATVETPWTVDGPGGSARRGATVEVAGDRVGVPAYVLPTAGRVRIALHAVARADGLAR
jgi:FAD synthetase